MIYRWDKKGSLNRSLIQLKEEVQTREHNNTIWQFVPNLNHLGEIPVNVKIRANEYAFQ